MREEDKLKYITEESFELFVKHGVKKTSMDMVSRNLGISKKTLYRHVKNKEDLLKKVFAYVDGQIRTRIHALLDLKLNAIDNLMKMSLIATARHQIINPVISIELRQYYPGIYQDYLVKKKKVIIDYIIQNLERGIKEGYYRLDLNKDIIAYLYFQKIEDLHFASGEKEEYSFEDIFSVMFDSHIRGIANSRGIKYFEQNKEKLTVK
ncbi:MAG: TetR/AcrR family transcriptional regulator [Bacteroidales bacterium]|nr:TetR/AcrR family transcriptional regulator [Bacteroidales bacterium]